MTKAQKISSRERVARRRAALRAQGLRPKQFWVHDTRRSGFWDEINRQMQALADDPRDTEDQAWVDSLQGQDELPAWEPE